LQCKPGALWIAQFVRVILQKKVSSHFQVTTAAMLQSKLLKKPLSSKACSSYEDLQEMQAFALKVLILTLRIARWNCFTTS